MMMLLLTRHSYRRMARVVVCLSVCHCG